MLTCRAVAPDGRSSLDPARAAATGRPSTAVTVSSGSPIGRRDRGVRTIPAGTGSMLPPAWRSRLFRSREWLATIASLDESLAQQPRKHCVVAEILPRDCQGRPTVALVVRVDLRHRGEDLLHRRKPEETLPSRQDVAEPGLLSDHRASRREVLRASLTEPPAAKPHVLILGNREFAARLPDILPIAIQIGGHAAGISHPPTIGLQELLVGLGVAAQGKLERLVHP